MRIKITNVFVDDQAKALQFYTGVLGFEKKVDVPAGEYRWLTVVQPEDRDGCELLLEPNVNPASRAFQQSIYEQGIPANMFMVDDLDTEYSRLIQLGVVFKQSPVDMGPVIIAILDDTCGNYIQLVQQKN